MCILHYHNLQLWTRSESLGKTYCVICGLGTCAWFTMSLTKLIWYTVLWYGRWVFRVCLVNESCSLYKFQDVCHARQQFFQRIWNSTSETERIRVVYTRLLWFKVMLCYFRHSITISVLSNIYIYISKYQDTQQLPRQQRQQQKQAQEDLVLPKNVSPCSVRVVFCPYDRVAFLPSVLRHGLRCVENCGIFVQLQFRARAVGQTHFGSTA